MKFLVVRRATTVRRHSFQFARDITTHNRLQEDVMESPKALDPEVVQSFVGSSHGDLERVRQLLDEHPTLVNASWDWGGGDWETGLGAAAHMGRRDIAELLLAHGARLDIFAAAMLGKLAIVKAIVDAFPDAHRQPGPHGIPLLNHAQAGGSDAAEVETYLRGLG
jgi:hypothetical protein